LAYYCQGLLVELLVIFGVGEAYIGEQLR
jgi:hypothetical protein